MSFERTKGSINNLSSGQVYTDDLLDMLVCVVRDVYESQNVTNVSAMEVRDQAVALKKMYNLIKMIQTVYEGNREGISQFGQQIQEQYKAAMNLLETQHKSLDEIAKDVEQQEQALVLLQEEAQKVETQRGHLLTIREECQTLEQRLEQLNDPALDQLAQRKVQLEADVKSREQQFEKLQQEIAQVQQRLEQLSEQIAQLTAGRDQAQQQLTQQQADLDKLSKEKTQLEADVLETKARLDAARTGIGQLPQMRQQINEEYRELQVQMTALTNAVNSARSDAFLQANLYTANAGGPLTVENYPDLAVASQQIKSWEELEEWFNRLKTRIDGLMQVYCDTMGAVVQKAETITVKKD